MADGTLQFKTSLDSSGLITGIRKAKADAEGNLSGLSGAFSKTGGKLTNFITKPALAAGAAIGGITLAKGFKRLTDIDTAKAKLEALGHSGKAVDGIMDSALTSVRGTSFGLGEAATTAASAVASGIAPGKQLTRYLSLVSDAAAVAGTDMDEMGMVFNKVAANGKLSAEELNMLTDRGVPALALLAKSTGKTVEEVRKDMAAGKISTDDFLDAIELGMGGAAKVMGSKSFTAAAANIGASLSRIGANFLDAGGKSGGFFSQLKPLMADLAEWLEKIELKSAEWGETFGAAVAKVVEVIRAMPSGLRAFILLMPMAIGPMLQLVGATMKANMAMKEFKTAQQGMSTMTGLLTGKIGLQQVALSKASGTLKNAASATKFFSKAMGQSISMIARGTVSMIANAVATSGVGTAASNSAKKVLAFAAAHKVALMASLGLVGGIAALAVYMSKTGKSADEVAATITTFANAVTATITQFSEQLPTIVNAIMPAVTEAITAFVGTIPALIPTLVQAGISLFMALVNSIQQIIPPLVAAVPQIVQAIVVAIPLLIPALIYAAVQLFMALVQAIPQAIPQIVAALPTIIAAIVQGLVSIGGALVGVGVQLLKLLWQGISSWVGSLGSKVAGFAKSLPGKIKSGIGSLISVGADWVRGLWNGIKSVKDWIISKIKGFGKSCLDAIKDFFGINSPSRVMAEIGTFMVQGLAKGITGSTKTAVAAVKAQAEQLRTAYDAGMQLPTIESDFGVATLAPQAVRSVINVAHPPAGADATVVNQTVNINQPVETPIETARALKRQAMFGLAGV